MLKNLKISVILSTHNRPKLLSNCLESLANQSLDYSKYEIILIDNYSSDNGKGTEKIFKNIVEKYPSLNIKLYFEKIIGGMTLPRHVGIDNSNGEIIICADDDYVADHRLLEEALKCFDDKSIHAICGKLYPSYETPPPKWVNAITTSLPDGGYYITDFSVIDLGNKSHEINWMYMFWSNWGIRREIYDQLNGFGPDGFAGEFMFYNGTGEHFLNKEIGRRGYKMVYCSGMSASHHVANYRYTKKYFKARYFHYGIVNSFQRVNENERVDTYPENFFYVLSKFRQLIKDLIKMPFFLKLRMIWVISGYLEHQKKVKQNNFLFNFCRIKNYKKFDFSKLIPFKNKRPGLW
tara:strand:+ start:727 stop:1773 length:1047 start_codon:yes stop_codon:yes gene_type:complete